MGPRRVASACRRTRETHRELRHFENQHRVSHLRREAPRWQHLPIGSGRGRPLRASRATRCRSRKGDGRQRQLRAEAKRPKAYSRRGRSRAARAQITDFPPPSGGTAGAALTAAEEVETIRRVLLEAATSTTRETWATCTCPECGKGFRQEIAVPDHGARIKAVETLLREGLGRVGEAEVAEPRMPSTVAEVEALNWGEMKFIFAISYAQAIRAFVDQGDEALRSEIGQWEPEARANVARVLTEFA
jgi:hypothetical protein